MNNKHFRYKKISKLLKNPNMFFYDYFRKKVYNGLPQQKQTNENKNTQPASIIDIFEINKIGLPEYIKNALNTGVSPEDGFDKNGLLIWSGYLNGLVSLIYNIREAMSMDVCIYTLGGGYSVYIKYEDKFDIANITQKLSSRPDFIIEVSNQIGNMSILHFYLYDISIDGLAVVRSNKAMIRKCAIDEIESIFVSRDIIENIDVVYTWVNQADMEWQEKWLETYPEDNFDPDRFTNNDELKYSLRSIYKYAPWVNKVFIVSNCAKPKWLSTSDKIVWVEHENIFPNEEMLPTFNSHAIESCLHRIPGLSEKFIYLNDDFMLSQPCLPSDFYDETGRSISYFEPYGMVYPDTKLLDIPDYMQASINSHKLIKKNYPKYEARNLHRHVPYSLNKSILMELEEKYPEAFFLTRSSKLRSNTDVNVTSFLYHHYAFVTGKSVKSELSSMIVRPGNIKSILSKDSFKYKILCFNDGNGSSLDDEYKKHTINFFNKRYAEKAPWEIDDSQEQPKDD